MARFTISQDYLLRTLSDLLQTPSPTGDTEWAISFVEQEFESLNIPSFHTHKGALIGRLEGLQSDRPRALSAHVDTLGAMVAEIKPNGRIKMAAIGALEWNSVESEGVWIQTRAGRKIRGSIVLENGAAHNNRDIHKAPRNAETLEIRIDEKTNTPRETRMLGIDVGDFVYLDPKTEILETGYVRSRFLDDKACVACLLAALKALQEAGVSPVQRTHFLISNYEEVGHGGYDSLPSDLTEFVVMDMAVVGEGRQGDEHHCSLCVKDGGGPYARKLSEKLRTIADQAGVDLKTDIYPYYTSDGTVYWRAGGGAEVALIGPGVDTSHAYERTHIEAMIDTALLVAEYLVTD